MKLSIFSEAKAMDGFGSEHGLSFFLEADGLKILFDTGASDLFLRNAQKMDLDPASADQVVLSHGHWDHGNGLEHISGLPLLCHPGCFRKRFRKLGKENIGLNMNREDAEKCFDLQLSADPVRLGEGLWFLGEIPRKNNFEARSTKYALEDGSEDFITDDSGLACLTEQGLVVISGCAHSGICNMVEHARNISGQSRVTAVIGGFHMKVRNEQLERSLAYFEESGAGRIYPSHCTMDQALEAFHQHFGKQELLAGMQLDF